MDTIGAKYQMGGAFGLHFGYLVIMEKLMYLSLIVNTPINVTPMCIYTELQIDSHAKTDILMDIRMLMIIMFFQWSGANLH